MRIASPVRDPCDLVDVPRHAGELRGGILQRLELRWIGLDEPADPARGDAQGAVPFDPAPGTPSVIS